MSVETGENTPESFEEFKKKRAETNGIEDRPFTSEEIDEKVVMFWQAHGAITETEKKNPLSAEIKKLGASHLPEFMNICPDAPVFYSVVAEQLDSYAEKLEEFNKLWRKFILGEEMAEEEKGMLEVFYRIFLKG